eukprot:907888-Prymnesium_polylepis.1
MQPRASPRPRSGGAPACFLRRSLVAVRAFTRTLGVRECATRADVRSHRLRLRRPRQACEHPHRPQVSAA